VRLAFDAKRLFNNFTGLGNYSRFVVDALAESFPENEYWLYTPRARAHPETSRYASAPFQVRKPEGMMAGAFTSIWRSYSLGSIACREGATILHGLSNELPVTKPSRLKTVLTVHDLIFRRYPSYYSAVDVAIYSWKLKQSLRKADRVIAVSEQTAADLKEFEKVSDDKLVVVNQGCASIFKQSYSKEAIQEVRARYDLPETFVLCVGTIEKRKNAALLIRAVSLMKEKVAVVIAGKPTTHADELLELVRQQGLEKHVRFIFQVPYADLPLLYRSATVFVYPSMFEGFGIPIVEAIVSKVPVITSTGSCFSEAGGPDCIYVNPSKPEELAVAITRVMDDATLRAAMVSKSLEYVRRFEPGVVASQIMNVYKEIQP
jgi:glycosyltransferase involved in cell wall biosynthesis